MFFILMVQYLYIAWLEGSLSMQLVISLWFPAQVGTLLETWSKLTYLLRRRNKKNLS